jgi:GTPase SAR1 family protein
MQYLTNLRKVRKKGEKMQKKVTLSFDDKIYEKFKKFCNDYGLMLSRTLEIDMIKKMDEKKKVEK